MQFSGADLEAAHRLVMSQMLPTPQYAWPKLAARFGAEIWVKHENHTPTGAFKVRGAITFMDWLIRTHPDVQGICTATRGNHGQGQARAAVAAGLRAKVYVPRGNSVEKNAAMQAFGAELIEFGDDFDEAKEEAICVAKAEGLFVVPPFHEELVRGVATYGFELFSAVPDLDTVYVPIGCGSGICGTIMARDALGCRAEIVGVVSDRAATAKLSVEAGRLIETDSARTFADGSRRPEVEASATRMTEQLQRIARGVTEPSTPSSIGDEHAARAAADLASRFDPRWGGFGAAPKFPPDGALALLLREHVRSGDRVPLDIACRTLDAMALGGMYDQLGGGFARYSVDERWLVPHFEKMLYNQALLVPVYVDAWLLTRRPLYRRVVEETLEFVRREMRSAEGGFHSSLDADSEGREGAFYVWSRDEIVTELGDADGARFCDAYGVTAEGNFEGLNILNLIDSPTPGDTAGRAAAEEALAGLAPLRRRLLAARARRPRPASDDKILTGWNGLMLTAYARAHRALGRDADLASARDAADFLLRSLLRGDRLLVSYRDGRAALNGYLDDYAFLARGLLDLYEAGFDTRHLDACASIARSLVRHFEDGEAGGFLFVSDDHEKLLTRNRSLHDGALPSGSGVAAEVLLRLGVHLDDDALKQAARRALCASEPHVGRFPSGHAALLAAAYLAEAPVAEVAVIGDPGSPETRALLDVVNRRYLPRLVLAATAPGAEVDALPLLRGKTAIDGRPTAHVCRDYACRRPTGDPGELARLLEELSSGVRFSP